MINLNKKLNIKNISIKNNRYILQKINIFYQI